MLSKKMKFCNNLHCKGDKLGKETRTECSLYYAGRQVFRGRLTRNPIILDSTENTCSSVWASLDSSDSLSCPKEASGLGKRFPKNRKAGM